MQHWADTYPHEIYASVILKNNKIKLWKVGKNKLCDKYDICGLKEAHPEYSYQEKCFVVNSDEEHNKVFNVDSKEWLEPGAAIDAH